MFFNKNKSEDDEIADKILDITTKMNEYSYSPVSKAGYFVPLLQEIIEQHPRHPGTKEADALITQLNRDRQTRLDRIAQLRGACPYCHAIEFEILESFLVGENYGNRRFEAEVVLCCGCGKTDIFAANLQRDTRQYDPTPHHFSGGGGLSRS